ncbi:MAG: hypothetical protein IJL09_07275, partial [Lachnospiraceae bacterium]|nr:hypothetical protein [Lachnospiraceae bacterium]
GSIPVLGIFSCNNIRFFNKRRISGVFLCPKSMKHKATLPFSVSWHYDKNVLNGTPVSKKAIGELVWAHFLDTGTICSTTEGATGQG